jgi:hypothetical protein
VVTDASFTLIAHKTLTLNSYSNSNSHLTYTMHRAPFPFHLSFFYFFHLHSTFGPGGFLIQRRMGRDPHGHGHVRFAIFGFMRDLQRKLTKRKTDLEIRGVVEYETVTMLSGGQYRERGPYCSYGKYETLLLARLLFRSSTFT